MVALFALFLYPVVHVTSLLDTLLPEHIPVMSSQQPAAVGLLPAVG
jgi:hypothetical protein